MNIDKPNMFREMIRTGINLFTGAGFSKLPDINGKSLPDASELCQEICDIFSIPSQYATDLEKVSNIVNLRAKQQFQDYLRGKYTVTDYNPLYDTLNLISIHSYITTNIDNIIAIVILFMMLSFTVQAKVVLQQFSTFHYMEMLKTSLPIYILGKTNWPMLIQITKNCLL